MAEKEKKKCRDCAHWGQIKPNGEMGCKLVSTMCINSEDKPSFSKIQSGSGSVSTKALLIGGGVLLAAVLLIKKLRTPAYLFEGETNGFV